MLGTTERVNELVNKIKDTNIFGCITGSCLTGVDMDDWLEEPDVDVFAYSETAMMYAVTYLMCMGFNPLDELEEWKIRQFVQMGHRNDDFNLTTVKLLDPDTKLVTNISFKKNQRCCMDVLKNFDLTIICKGYDIWSKQTFDCTRFGSLGDPSVAELNPMRRVTYSKWNTSRWIRQFDRVAKYWQRGFDTRPAARQYVEMIDEVLKNGNIFKSEQAKENWEAFKEELLVSRALIQTWLEEKGEED